MCCSLFEKEAKVEIELFMMELLEILEVGMEVVQKRQDLEMVNSGRHQYQL